MFQILWGKKWRTSGAKIVITCISLLNVTLGQMQKQWEKSNKEGTGVGLEWWIYMKLCISGENVLLKSRFFYLLAKSCMDFTLQPLDESMRNISSLQRMTFFFFFYYENAGLLPTLTELVFWQLLGGPKPWQCTSRYDLTVPVILADQKSQLSASIQRALSSSCLVSWRLACKVNLCLPEKIHVD